MDDVSPIVTHSNGYTLLGKINVEKNKVKNSSCCGRTFSNWTQILPIGACIGATGIAVYEYIKNFYVIAGIATAIAVMSFFANCAIAYFSSQKKLSEELDTMKDNGNLFKENQKDIVVEQGMQTNELNKITVISDGITQNNNQFEKIEKNFHQDIVKNSEEKNETLKQMNSYILKIDELKKMLETASEKEKISENNRKEMELIEKNLKEKLEKSVESNQQLAKNVQNLQSEISNLQKVEDNISKDIKNLESQELKFKNLSEKFNEVAQTNKKLEEELENTTKERDELESKLEKINNMLQSETQELEMTAKNLLLQIVDKEKELKKLIETYEDYSFRYEEIKKELENINSQLGEDDDNN